MQDDLSARMNGYEAAEAQRRLDVLLPICARIDGRRFSRFTRGFEKPFDSDLSEAMRATCAALVEHTHAKIGYVQSDEITLIWRADAEGSSVFFDGRVQKMCSVLAALATARFSMLLSEMHPAEVAQRMPVFDARVWQVPSEDEAANVIVWRAQDARRNAILSMGQAHLSHRQMHGLRRAAVCSDLLERGVDMADLPDADRFGVYCQRVTRERVLTDAEMEAIPERHRPTGPVLRSAVERLPIGYFGDVANRTDVIFRGAAPQFRPGG